MPAPSLAPPPVRTEPPSPSLAHRVWFVWDALWGAVFSLLLSPGVVVHSAFRPTARTLRTWMGPWGRSVLALMRVRQHVVRRAPLPEGPVVFVANHQNAFDIPATVVGLPRPFLFLARHELRGWPIVGWVLEKTACIFIPRDNPRAALASLQDAAGRIRGGESVLLFPEGGRSHSHQLAPFMRGPFVLAIEAGVPVVPVTLAGHVGVIDEGAKLARPGHTAIVIGAPIPTEGLRRGDAATLGDRVRAVMEEELGQFG